MSSPASAPEGDLRARVEALDWYHTIELAPGLLTPGWFDLRGFVDQVGFPGDLSGKRCLDVGSFDGFWAFTMEQRAAEEVVAVDVLDPHGWDWPIGSDSETVAAIGKRKAKGAGFEIARESLGSSVQRHERSVYDLDPDELGTFDFVYVGSLLLHLRDPIRAIERVRSVCRGEALFVDAIDLELEILRKRPVVELDGLGRPWWWRPSMAGFVRMVEVGGFELASKPRRFFMPPGGGHNVTKVKPRALLNKAGRLNAITAWRGDPHASILGRPRA
ncbi:MAG: class I SAM-dependent methyltransferase [Thermoleophilaceae bacterium]